MLVFLERKHQLKVKNTVPLQRMVPSRSELRATAIPSIVQAHISSSPVLKESLKVRENTQSLSRTWSLEQEFHINWKAVM